MILLPPGYNHKYQLHVIRDIHSDAGSLDKNAGGRKAVTHITVTDERHVHTAAQILVNEGFEPNVLIGFDLHAKRPFLYQFASLDHASKALQHPPGTLETNRGGPIVCQMEIACEVADVAQFHEIQMYKVLANAWHLINDHLEPHRIPWHLWSPAVERASATRLGAVEYIAASGHGGHRNVPNQPAGHDDPTRFFSWKSLLHSLHHGPWDLSHAGF